MGPNQQNSETQKLSFLDLWGVIDKLKTMDVGRVIFLGGEPTIDPELSDLARILHADLNTYNILLTNGHSLPDLEDVNEVQLSIKAYTDTIHQEFTGKSNAKVLKNFEGLYSQGVKLRSESIFIPGYIDLEEIEKIAEFISSIDPKIMYRIDGYVPVPGMPWRRPKPKEVERAVTVAKRYLREVSCLRGDEDLRYEVLNIF